MTDKTISFSNFGPTFQRKLGQVIFEDHIFAEQLFEVLKNEFFTVSYIRDFVRGIREYKEKYASYPSEEIMESVISSQMDDVPDLVKKQMVEYFSNIKSRPVSDIEYIKANSLDFCKRQSLKVALFDIVNSIEDGSYEDSARVIEKALQLGTNRDIGHELIIDFEKRYTLSPRIPIPTGQQVLDNLISGGLAKKELGVLIGGTSSGKSSAMVNFVASAIQNDYNAIYYTLELQDSVVGKRFDSCITSYPMSDLDANKEFVHAKMSEKVTGKLIIKEYPTGYATLQMIKNHLDKTIRTKFKPDVVVIDYADIMKFSIPKGSTKYDALGSLYQELRGIAVQYKVALWTVSQTNRTGYSAEIVSVDHMSDAFSKAFIADLVVTMQRTPAQKTRNEATFFLAKNRNGPDGIILKGTANLSSMHISIDAQKTEEEFDDEQKVVKQDLGKRLYRKFANIKNNRAQTEDDPF